MRRVPFTFIEVYWQAMRSPAFVTYLQQKYLKNIGHFSVIDTEECFFVMQILMGKED